MKIEISKGTLISIESLVGSEACTREKRVVWGAAANLRFH
jgi:hypothetical protein